jgi:hypothetical protein
MKKVIFSTASAKFVIAASLTIISFLLIVSGEEIFAQQRGTISVDRAMALPLTTAEGNQVKVRINYSIGDESLVGQRVNAIMGIYDRLNGSLVKLSSFPYGFIINNSEGTTQLTTTLTDPNVQNISAIVTLTNADKSEKYTNDVRADLDLRTILPTTLPPLLEEVPPSQSEDDAGGEEEDSPSGNGPGSEE